MPKRSHDKVDSGTKDERPQKRLRADRLSNLSDELLLRTLSFLAISDLAVCERLSRRFKTLANDGQIWKALYYERFVRPRASRIPGVRQQSNLADSLRCSSKISRWLSDERLVKEGSSTNWKRQYKLRHNWTRGSARITETEVAERPSTPPLLVRLHDDSIILADKVSGLRAWKLRGERRLIATQALQASSSAPHRGPTSMAVDMSNSNPGASDISVGFEDGSFSLYRLRKEGQAFAHQYTHPPSINGSLTAVAYFAPYLLTMDQEPRLSLYYLGRDWMSDTKSALEPPQLLSSMKSHTAYSPLSLSLRASGSSITASIAYAIPWYITKWSVGLQELRLARDGSFLDSRVASADTTTLTARKRNLIDAVQKGVIPLQNMPSSRPVSLSYNHPYLLTAQPNNTLTLYVVTSAKDELTVSSGTVLWGHTSAISGAHISDRGKAISVSRRGNELRVWELEGRGSSFNTQKQAPPEQSSVQVRPAIGDVSKADLSWTFGEKTEEVSKGWLAFDEEKVVLLKEKMHGAQAVVTYDFS